MGFSSAIVKVEDQEVWKMKQDIFIYNWTDPITVTQ